MVQHFLAVQIEAEPFSQPAHIYVIVWVLIVGTDTFPAGSGSPVGLWGALEFRRVSVIWDLAGFVPGRSWWGCTNHFLGGSSRGQHSIVQGWGRRDCTGIVVGGLWEHPTGLFHGLSTGSIPSSIFGHVHHMVSNISPIHFFFLSGFWWFWRLKYLALIG
jgi:hypothetical protein